VLNRFIKNNLFAGYSIATVIAIGAVWTQILLGPVTNVASYLLLTPAVLFTALVVGFGPALLCDILCAAGCYYFFLTPKQTISSPPAIELASLGIFFVNAAIFSWFITHWQRAREQITVNDTTFHETIELAPVGIAHVDLDGHWLRLNQAACSILGYSEAELSTMTFDEVTYPEDLAEDRRKLDELLRGTTKSYKMEKRYVRKDGSLTWANLMVSLVRDDRNEPKYFISCIEDLTERKKNEEKLHDAFVASSRLAAIIESSNDAIISTDLSGKIESWNSGATRMYGYEPNEAIGKRIDLIVPPEFMPHEEEIFRRVGAGNFLRHYETERIAKDGSRVEVSLSVTPVKNRSGQIVGVSKTARDISHLKQVERALQEALRSRDEFISIASHELKTPVTVLRLQSDLLRRKQKRKGSELISSMDLERFSTTVESQTDRLTRLVDDILDLSRIRAGKLSIKKEPLRLDELVRKVVDRLQEALNESGTPVIFECLEEIEGYFDRLRIEQVLTNLLTNAMRYGARKPVYLRLERAVGDSNRIRLSVRDQGNGIAREAQKKIFDRFERAGATEASGKGLGLGLFITRQIVQAHEGRIWVESAGPGQGSTFIVELPEMKLAQTAVAS
jgi:PAS domain S-box-containing protein